MAKILKLKCPECNAPINIDIKKPARYCSYCGTPIYFDDGVKRFEVKSHHEEIIRDEAKIIEAHNRLAVEKERTKQATAETRDLITTFIIFLILLVLIYVSFKFL